MNENAFKKALYGKLAGDSTLTAMLAGTASVFDRKAPENEPRPYVIFQKQAGSAQFTFTARAFDNKVYVVKGVVDEDSTKAATSIAERIDAVLTDAQLNLDTGALLYLRRESDIEYDEINDGIRTNHAGAMFRALVT